MNQKVSKPPQKENQKEKRIPQYLAPAFALTGLKMTHHGNSPVDGPLNGESGTWKTAIVIGDRA